MADRQLREDVLTAMAAVAHAGMKAGLDGFDLDKHMEGKFPGVPDSVIWDAVSRASIQRKEEWWQQVEATIDCEAVRRAVVSISDGNGGGK